MTDRQHDTRQETHGSHGTHNRQEERRTSGGKEERGARMAARLGSGGGGEQRGDTAAGREQREQTEKRVCNIFKGEKERKNAAETHKSV